MVRSFRCRRRRSRKSDRILLRAGDRLPADGMVVGGKSDLDQSLITGETAQRDVTAGAEVYAGSIVLNGTLTVRVTAAGQRHHPRRDRSPARESGKGKIALCPALRSGGVLLRSRRAYRGGAHLRRLDSGGCVRALTLILMAITVLMITCPCALALAIPAVQVVAAGGMFRAGIFLNAGDAIERLAEVDTVAFDKTGTLTLPEPRVINADEVEPELLELAARLASASRHPLAAVVARYTADPTAARRRRRRAGAGVRAQVEGVEARLGSAAFCGIPEFQTIGGVESGWRLIDRFSLGRSARDADRSASAASRWAGRHAAYLKSWTQARDHFRRPRSRRCPGRGDARDRGSGKRR